MEKETIRIPGWKIIRTIGKGSFGTVYEIEKEGSFGAVAHSALKVITIPETDAEIKAYRDDGYDDLSLTALFRSQVESITAEFELMSKLKGHSNIVSYEDHTIVQHDNDPGYDIFIRMELLTSLPDYYNKTCVNNQIAEQTAIKLGIDICKALELCARNHIIHRDIKPQNIFVNDNRDFKLGDFGIAKTADHTTKATKTGTYGYMAPEVYWGRPYNASVDIYSLGLVLYWLLNERRGPFLPVPPAIPTVVQSTEAIDRRMNGALLPAPKYGSEVLKRIVMRACAFDPKQRYTSPTEMRMDLERLLGGNPSISTIRERTSGTVFSDETVNQKTTGAFAGIRPEDTRGNDKDATIGIFTSKGGKTAANATQSKHKGTAPSEQNNAAQRSAAAGQIDVEHDHPLKKQKSKKPLIILIIIGAVVFGIIMTVLAAVSCYACRQSKRLSTASTTALPAPQLTTTADPNAAAHTTPTATAKATSTTTSEQTATPEPAETASPVPTVIQTPVPSEKPEAFSFGGEVFQTGTTQIGAYDSDTRHKKIEGTKDKPLHITAEEMNDLVALCPDLKVLILDYCYFDDYSKIGELTNLKTLCLMSCGDKNGAKALTDVSWISSLTSLETLNICHNDVDDIGSFSSLLNIRYLNIADNQGLRDSDLAALQNMAKLESLDMYSLPAISDVSCLSANSSLRYLHLGNDKKITSVKALTSLSKLSRLRLNGTGVNDLSYFSSFSALEMLDVSSSNRDQQQYYALLYCSRLKHLVISDISDDVKSALLNNGIELYKKWQSDSWNLD